ncbi:hypothetical protein MPTK1_5g16040 [Marchantia polymorpha subsp. ruderalis]|uniref:Calcineurin-like phosphoesterase domain-containing protein n=2 Tax=Marchantia polymorpha TaxID=3197 RepID=A0AAF6BIU9_MARPO|nr:hypothetical protein MARPO_0071s0006 [Marchantia polymorpha]BBN11933.1 hypothetical protein Mp_5g16040 [Marchantia polymorpha subsp. ruderalis]|eukprot:PTQ35387.1 hypothetical protein MARPO_0071s0006 [Marchantia polymorpha]
MERFISCISVLGVLLAASFCQHAEAGKLRFSSDGQFKIVQVADMHYADGAHTKCLDVLPEEMATCSDLNTTAFQWRMIKQEHPDLVVFTGDNIFQRDSSNATASLIAAFAPVIEARIPWAAVLGNHDQEGHMTREEVMAFIVKMDYSMAQMNPNFLHGDRTTIDGYGNYIIEVEGPAGSMFENKSLLNLYMVDSGDYSFIPQVSYYDWIKSNQQVWLQQASAEIQKAYRGVKPRPQTKAASALAFHHIPIPESFTTPNASNLGEKNEASGSPSLNSGFLTTLITMGDVQAAFTGHDHLNDYCGAADGPLFLCYSGGFGYHAYGKAGWPRRSRVITAYLNGNAASWDDVSHIQTYKRLDDDGFTKIDEQTLYTNYVLSPE